MLKTDIPLRLNRLEFRTLSYFLTVCQHQNLTAAAEQMGTTKSVLSEACATVELVFELPLFDRRTSGIYPNAQGQLVAQYVFLLQNLEQYISRMAGHSFNALTCFNLKLPARFWGGAVHSALAHTFNVCEKTHPDVLIWPEFLGQSNIEEKMAHAETGLDWTEHAWRPAWSQIGRARLVLLADETLPDNHEALISEPWLLLSPVTSNLADELTLDDLKREKLTLPRMPWPMLQQIADFCMAQHLSFEHEAKDITSLLMDKTSPDTRILINGLLLPTKSLQHWQCSRIDLPLSMTLALKSRGTHPIVQTFKNALQTAWTHRAEPPTVWQPRTSLKQWRYFGGTLEKGSMSEAAKSLFLSQPALSMQLKQFEHNLETTVIARKTGTRRLILTEAGEVIRQVQHGLLDLINVMGQYCQQHKLSKSQCLYLGVLPSVDAHSRLLDLIVNQTSTWLRQYPNLRLEIIEERHQYLMHALRNQALHFAITETDSPWVIQLPLGEPEEMGLVIAAELLPDASTTELDWRAIEHLPLVLPRKGSGMRILIDSHCLQQGITLKPAMESDSLNINRAWVMQGLYATVLPKSALASAFEGQSNLRFIHLRPSLERVLRLAYLGNRSLNSTEESLLAHLTHQQF